MQGTYSGTWDGHRGADRVLVRVSGDGGFRQRGNGFAAVPDAGLCAVLFVFERADRGQHQRRSGHRS